MNGIKQYHLHKDDYSKLHFEIQDAESYCEKNAHHCFKAHRHSFYQLLWFKEPGTHFVDYEVVSHPGNTLFFLHKAQVHYFCPVSANKGTLFHFNDLFLQQQPSATDSWIQYRLFNEVGKPYVVLPEKEVNTMEQLCRLLKQELEERDYNYRVQAYHLFQTLLLKIERLKQQQTSTIEKLDHNFEKAMEFKKLVEQHLQESFSITYYASQLGMSTKKLTALSSQYLLKTPSTWIHERKVLEAKRLLCNLKISIKEVGFSLGFEQATYFTKYFKKHTGYTPKEFVQQLP